MSGLVIHAFYVSQIRRSLISHHYAVSFLDNIFIEFGTKLYRQIVYIPMGTDCTPLIAASFCFTMKEILWPFFLIMKKLKLFKHLTLHLDI